jgi:hypothetical protein
MEAKPGSIFWDLGEFGVNSCLPAGDLEDPVRLLAPELGPNRFLTTGLDNGPLEEGPL